MNCFYFVIWFKGFLACLEANGESLTQEHIQMIKEAANLAFDNELKMKKNLDKEDVL